MRSYLKKKSFYLLLKFYMFVVYELSVLLSVWMWVSLWWVRTTTLSVLVYYNTRVQDNIYNSNHSKFSVETGRCNFTWLSTQSWGGRASLIHKGTLWTFIRSLIVVFLAWKVFNSDNFLQFFCSINLQITITENPQLKIVNS